MHNWRQNFLPLLIERKIGQMETKRFGGKDSRLVSLVKTVAAAARTDASFNTTAAFSFGRETEAGPGGGGPKCQLPENYFYVSKVGSALLRVGANSAFALVSVCP